MNHVVLFPKFKDLFPKFKYFLIKYLFPKFKHFQIINSSLE